MAYIGKSPETDSAVKKYEYTATAGQTTFSASYETRVDVYLNGVLLSETDYTATDGTSIVLDSGAANGDIVQIDAFQNLTNARLNFTIDEDDMSSDSDALVPTQQSVKAYVDSRIASKDALSELSGDSDDITEGSTNLFFTSAEQTKLSGIEASADVTDTANVTAAGALMDSEVTNLAQVKAFDSSDYATAAQGTKADSALQPTGDGSQLTGIDALPSQTGNSGKYLTTDGTDASWADLGTYLGILNRSGSSIEVSLSSSTTLGILNRDGSTTTSVSLSV